MKEKLTDIFKRMFNLESISDGMSPENVEGWDSYTHIELVLELEGEYGVSISAEQAVELVSVGQIIEFLKSQGIEYSG